jgi:hypothetical protein
MLSRADKEDRERRNQRIFDLWMACYTQEEIAEQERLTQQVIQTVLQESSDLKIFVKSDVALVEHAVDFLPIYNTWKQQIKTEGSSHFGNTEVCWLDNLLYLLHSLSMLSWIHSRGPIDHRHLQEAFPPLLGEVSDRKPIVEREKEIREHDITTGLPRLPILLPSVLVLRAANKTSAQRGRSRTKRSEARREAEIRPN